MSADNMSTSIQSLQGANVNTNPNPPAQPQPLGMEQQEKKVTFQQQAPPTQPMNRMPHRLPKQEMPLPHPGAPLRPELQKGLKVPPTSTPSNNELNGQLKETGVVTVLSMLLYSNILQDCLMNVIPNGRYENRPTLVVSLLTSVILGCAFFSVKKFLL